MTHPRLSIGIALVLGFASVTLAADGAGAASGDCARSGSNVRIAAHPAEAPASARVYFHADGKPGDYYLDMRRGASGEAWAVLPRTAPGTQSIAYKIRTTDAAGVEKTSAETRLAVAGGCAVPSFSPEEKSYASNLVVGQTMEEQGIVPPGFLCDGIVSLISSKGEMRSSMACRDMEVRVGGGTALKGATGASGNVVIHENTGGTAVPLSSARPAGSSPKP